MKIDVCPRNGRKTKKLYEEGERDRESPVWIPMMIKPNFKEEFNSNSFTGWRDKNKLWEGGGIDGQTDKSEI